MPDYRAASYEYGGQTFWFARSSWGVVTGAHLSREAAELEAKWIDELEDMKRILLCAQEEQNQTALTRAQEMQDSRLREYREKFGDRRTERVTQEQLNLLQNEGWSFWTCKIRGSTVIICYHEDRGFLSQLCRNFGQVMAYIDQENARADTRARQTRP